MGNSNNTGKVIGALLLGAAVGGALGILFAPDKGSETRKKIAEKTGDLTESLKEKFKSILKQTKEEFETSTEKVSEFAENGSGKFAMHGKGK